MPLEETSLPNGILRDVVVDGRYIWVEEAHAESHPVRIAQCCVDCITSCRLLRNSVGQMVLVCIATVIFHKIYNLVNAHWTVSVHFTNLSISVPP